MPVSAWGSRWLVERVSVLRPWISNDGGRRFLVRTVPHSLKGSRYWLQELCSHCGQNPLWCGPSAPFWVASCAYALPPSPGAYRRYLAIRRSCGGRRDHEAALRWGQSHGPTAGDGQLIGAHRAGSMIQARVLRWLSGSSRVGARYVSPPLAKSGPAPVASLEYWARRRCRVLGPSRNSLETAVVRECRSPATRALAGLRWIVATRCL